MIGPTKAGKSTLAPLLAKRLGVPACSLDDVRWQYIREIGYDKQMDNLFRDLGRTSAACFYWQLFSPYAVERFLAEHSGCVMDFGAGHTVYNSMEMLERVERALAPYPNVFLILPSPTPDESIRILNQRLAEEGVRFNFDFSAHFVNHPSNYRLAKAIVYTEGETPEQTADDILAITTR